jgi:DNA-binding Lrp family transcriptional regulator
MQFGLAGSRRFGGFTAVTGERQMDAKDLTILEMLRANARTPLKTIAGTVGLASSSVRERIARMEAAGAIAGYSARVGLDMPGVSAILLIGLATTPDRETVADLVSMEAVRRCWSVAGDIDLIVEIWRSGMTPLNAARDAIATHPGVRSVTTAPVLLHEKDG